MPRILWVLFGILLMTSRPSYADVKSAEVVQPVWEKGASWIIKCPDLSPDPVTDTCSILSEYSIKVTVLGTGKAINGTKCSLLEIRPGDDLPEHIKKYSDLIIEHIYYDISTLELVQIEDWKIGADGTETKIGRKTTSSKSPLSTEYYFKNGSWIPILLP